MIGELGRALLAAVGDACVRQLVRRLPVELSSYGRNGSRARCVCPLNRPRAIHDTATGSATAAKLAAVNRSLRMMKGKIGCSKRQSAGMIARESFSLSHPELVRWQVL